jgi:hypothetical protein
MRNVARSKRALACLSFALCAVFGACKDECKSGATECLSTSLIRTCVPGSDSNEWLVSQCDPNETCQKNGVLKADDEDAGPGADAAVSGSDAGASKPSGQAACTAACTTGAHECVSNGLARYCVAGGIWALDACDVGEKCVNGSCAVGQGKGSVQACVPGTKACASSRVEKVCDVDGSGWVQTTCAADETCDSSKNSCTADPQSSCDDGGSCLDNKTALRCLGQADGYMLEPCSGDLYCEGGRCRGAVCAVGSSCIGSNQVRACVDGNSYLR